MFKVITAIAIIALLSFIGSLAIDYLFDKDGQDED